jgi:hypothetical protein
MGECEMNAPQVLSTKEALSFEDTLKLALEALEGWGKGFPDNWGDLDTEAVNAIKEVLAQPEQSTECGEPVASIFISGIGEREFDDWSCKLPIGRNLLYTHPPVPTAQPNLEKIADDLQELCDKQALRIGALEAQLAQPKEPEQEPVATVIDKYLDRTNNLRTCIDKDLPLFTKLYTTPPQRPSRSDIKPLTDQHCTWQQSDDVNMPDTWEADCGAIWTFTEGGPKDNDLHYCPKCGKPAIEAAHGIKSGTDVKE